MGKGYRRSEKHIAADSAIEDAKSMIRGRAGVKDFKSAVAKVEKAIKLYPSVRNGREMLTVCQILHMSKTFTPKPDEETWPYDLLQIPSSSTESKVKSRYRELMADMRTIKGKFTSVSVAVKFLQDTMYVYNRKVNLENDEDEDEVDDIDDEEDDKDDKDYDEKEDDEKKEEKEKQKDDNATADDGDDGDDENPFAWSPVFKKLRREVFTTLPQKPHFSPLSKYSSGVREEMKVGFDVIFVKLIQKIQDLSDTLSPEEEDNIRGEMSNLEEMGYDVKKLRERFDLLVRLVKEDREMEKEFEAHISDEMVQLKMMQSRISELEKKQKLSKTQGIALKSEIAALKSKVDKHGDMSIMLEEFRSIGMDIWK